MAGDGLRLDDIHKRFDTGVQAVGGVSLDIAGGEFVAFVGPSGCGKSTLLRIIAGLERPTRGAVHIDGEPNAAYVFQDAHLMPWRTLLRNVELPLELRGIGRVERRSRAERAICRVGLAEFIHAYPAQLSGGMRMRASLARALVVEPTLLLLDEPFAALDEITRQGLDDQLRDLWIERRMTTLFVTHSIAEAVYLATRAVVFSPRPARVLLDRPIDLPEQRDRTLRGTLEFVRHSEELSAALHGDLRETA